ncbi:MAG: hypothetical protein Kow0026_10000 [Oricola sp.]
MQIDWALAIRRNRADLLGILAGLFALAGLAADGPGGGRDPGAVPPSVTLPRRLHNYLRRVLRSAESAVRRLVVVAARDIAVIVRHAPALRRPEARGGENVRAPFSPLAGEMSARAGRGKDAAPPSPPHAGTIGPLTVTVRPEPPAPPAKPAGSAPRIVRVPFDPGLARLHCVPGPAPDGGQPPAPGAIPAFPLADPRKRFGFACGRRARARPRICSLGGDALPVYLRRPDPPDPAPPMPDDPVPAAALLRRLLALKRALDNLDNEARRLARREARRRRRPFAHRRAGYAPMRPGWPPGWRNRNRYGVDEVLKECHRLALWAGGHDP